MRQRNRFRDISLGSRVLLGFGSVLLLGATSGALLWSSQRLLAEQQQLLHHQLLQAPASAPATARHATVLVEHALPQLDANRQLARQLAAAQTSAERRSLLAALFGGGAVLAALMSVIAIDRSTRVPLARATRAIEALRRGDLDHRVRIERLDEYGRLLVAIDQLTNWLALVLDDDILEPPQPLPSPQAVTTSLDILLDDLAQLQPAEPPLTETAATAAGMSPMRSAALASVSPG